MTLSSRRLHCYQGIDKGIAGRDMDLLDIEKLQLFFLFAVPGIIALYVRAQFLDGKMPSFADGLFVYVTLSLFYHAVWFVIFPSVYSISLSSATVSQKFQLSGLVFLAPVFIGLLSAANIRSQWIQNALRRYGVSVLHPIGTAWDWKFSNTKENWVTVTLKDGNVWRGVIGANSFMSSSPQERDIFIEKVYTLGDNEEWIERESSVLITHSEVQTIEFWRKATEHGK